MNIMHVSKKYPNALGGDTVVVASLLKQQTAAGHKVRIVTSNCDEIINARYVTKFGLNDSPANLDKITPKRLVSLIMLFFKISKILKREQPDVIHSHSIDMTFIISWAARRLDIPLVHTFHIVTFYDKNQSFLRRNTEIWLAKRAKPNIITAPNIYDVNKLRLAGLKQAILLPNGVDIKFWELSLNHKNNKIFEFLSVGRLERQKGYEHLIRAAYLLVNIPANKRLVNFHINIVGDGSEATKLRQLIKALNLDSVISLTGKKRPKAVRDLMHNADAAIFPSLYETTPITLLEAWAVKLPTIITKVGILRGAPSNFDATIIVPPRDDRSLAKAMELIMTDDKTRDRVAAKGYLEAKKYAWPVIARTAEALYRSAG